MIVNKKNIDIKLEFFKFQKKIFKKNTVTLLNKQKNPIGTRILESLLQSLKKKKLQKFKRMMVFHHSSNTFLKKKNFIKSVNSMMYVIDSCFLYTNSLLYLIDSSSLLKFFCSLGNFFYTKRSKKIKVFVFKFIFVNVVSKLKFLIKKGFIVKQLIGENFIVLNTIFVFLFIICVFLLIIRYSFNDEFLKKRPLIERWILSTWERMRDISEDFRYGRETDPTFLDWLNKEFDYYYPKFLKERDITEMRKEERGALRAKAKAMSKEILAEEAKPKESQNLEWIWWKRHLYKRFNSEFTWQEKEQIKWRDKNFWLEKKIEPLVKKVTAEMEKSKKSWERSKKSWNLKPLEYKMSKIASYRKSVLKNLNQEWNRLYRLRKIGYIKKEGIVSKDKPGRPKKTERQKYKTQLKKLTLKLLKCKCKSVGRPKLSKIEKLERKIERTTNKLNNLSLEPTQITATSKKVRGRPKKTERQKYEKQLQKYKAQLQQLKLQLKSKCKKVGRPKLSTIEKLERKIERTTNKLNSLPLDLEEILDNELQEHKNRFQELKFQLKNASETIKDGKPDYLVKRIVRIKKSIKNIVDKINICTKGRSIFFKKSWQ